MNVPASNANTSDVRAVFVQWIDAVKRLDLEGTVARHMPDVLMFDVPEPGNVRGIDAYRECWRDFFPFIADGGVFEVSNLEIVAGDDAAFSHCIVRCGRSRDDTFPVRLTLGYRKLGEQWMIAHEHHSVAAQA